MEQQQTGVRCRACSVNGAILGGFLAVILWGIDAAWLFSNHNAYFWLKFALGFPVAVALGFACGWIAGRFQRLPITVVSWAVNGLLITIWSSFISNSLYLPMIQMIDPILAGKLTYPPPSLYTRVLPVAAAISIVLCILTSILFDSQMDTMQFGTQWGSRLFALLIPFFLMAINGAALDEIYNKDMREPVRYVNATILLARSTSQKTGPLTKEEKLNLLVTGPLLEIVHRPYQIIIATYEPGMDSADVLVNFDGDWARCHYTYNRVNQCRLEP